MFVTSLSAEDTAVLNEEQGEGVGEVKAGLFCESGVVLHDDIEVKAGLFGVIGCPVSHLRFF